jgi:nucleoside-diphosphate-sugar epimerase
VYGNAGKNLGPVREDMLTDPASPYALQKLQAEQVGSLFSKIYDLPIVSLRFFNVYGPGQSGTSAYSTAIASWITKIKNGDPLRLDGDGEQTRDYIHVWDVALACLNAMHSTQAGIFNIASGKSVSNNDILNMLKKYCNFEVENAPARKGDIKHSLAAIQKAKDNLDFKVTVQLKDGIEYLLKSGYDTNE